MTRTPARGACPRLAAPMQTGDGLLARLLPVAPIPLDAFTGLCRAARAHGNGIIEISARGSFQVRGLTPLSAPLFAATVHRLAIPISDCVPVIADPLPGDPATLVDANAIAAALRQALAEKALQLAPKLSVLVDGGGSIDLDTIFADIRLRAVATSAGPKFQVALSGDAASATAIATIAPKRAVETALELLGRIAALGANARAADLLPASEPETSLRPPRTDVIAPHPIKDGGFALGLGLAFGHAAAEALESLLQIAKSNGADWARPATGRALLLGPLDTAKISAVGRVATSLGFVTEVDDPRRRIAACAGAPLCAHGLIAARTLAAEIAREVPLPCGGGIAMHVSGCAKGCAHPARALLTIVGTEKGCGIVRNGMPRSMPTTYVDANELVAALQATVGKKKEVVHA